MTSLATPFSVFDDADRRHMARAIELARGGEGFVEPNPMVGCVLVSATGGAIAEGFHRLFGGPHAEAEALANCERSPHGSTAYVTLEPCCHHGKTPPCTDALLTAGVQRVVIANLDPFPKVAGGGVAELTGAGVRVEVGLLADEARELNAPYFKRVQTGRPWIIAKWAMTLDGKIATHTGESRWISGEQARAVVHRLRGRMDAIMIGSRTAALDDPLLTARPPGPRVATRVVFDPAAALSPASQLCRTAGETPTLLLTGPMAEQDRVAALRQTGCEVLGCEGADKTEQLLAGLDELGRLSMTNVLVEGGGGLLGALFDAGQIDEVHAFIAPRLIGGAVAATPIAGRGTAEMAQTMELAHLRVQTLGPDVYIHARTPCQKSGERG